MALISVMSAKGAPGVTTSAMLLASLWPTPSILVDADPLGGDVALRLLRDDGHPLDPDRGLMSLLPAARRGMTPEMTRQHAQPAIGGQPVLCGLAGPEQALAVAPLWPVLAEAFSQVSAADVIADLGQVHGRSPHVSMVERSTVVLIVYRPTAWSAVHTRRRIDMFGDLLGDRGIRAGIVCVADSKSARDIAAASTAIRQDRPWLKDFGQVALDPKAVVMFEGGSVFRPERTLLARSGRTLADQVHAEVPA